VLTKNGKPCRIYVTGTWAFVPVEKGGPNGVVLYMKVPRCVVYVDCPNSSCGAKAGERCNGRNGPTTQVHCGRKRMAQAALERQPDHKIHNLGPMEVG